jgi:hypothetical protein
MRSVGAEGVIIADKSFQGRTINHCWPMFRV